MEVMGSDPKEPMRFLVDTLGFKEDIPGQRQELPQAGSNAAAWDASWRTRQDPFVLDHLHHKDHTTRNKPT